METRKFGDDVVYYLDGDKNGQPFNAKVQTASDKGRALDLLVLPATGGAVRLYQNVRHVDDAVLKANPSQRQRKGAWDYIASHNAREEERQELVRQRNLAQSTMPPLDFNPLDISRQPPLPPVETTEDKLLRLAATDNSPEFICQVLGDDEWPLDKVRAFLADVKKPKRKKELATA